MRSCCSSASSKPFGTSSMTSQRPIRRLERSRKIAMYQDYITHDAVLVHASEDRGGALSVAREARTVVSSRPRTRSIRPSSHRMRRRLRPTGAIDFVDDTWTRAIPAGTVAKAAKYATTRLRARDALKRGQEACKRRSSLPDELRRPRQTGRSGFGIRRRSGTRSRTKIGMIVSCRRYIVDSAPRANSHAPPRNPQPLRHLRHRRRGRSRRSTAIDLDVDAGEVVAIVGESGSGKSVAMLAVMGLLPKTATVTADRLAFAGEDLLRCRRAAAGRSSARTSR